MTKSIKKKKPSEKKSKVPSYRKKILEQNAVKKIQMYYITSELVPPVGEIFSWYINGEYINGEESVFEEVINEHLDIGFDLNKNMLLFPKILE